LDLRGGLRRGGGGLAEQASPDLVGDVFLDGAGVGLFLRNAEFRQKIQDDAGFHLQLASQFIDADLTHV